MSTFAFRGAEFDVLEDGTLSIGGQTVFQVFPKLPLMYSGGPVFDDDDMVIGSVGPAWGSISSHSVSYRLVNGEVVEEIVSYREAPGKPI